MQTNSFIVDPDLLSIVNQHGWRQDKNGYWRARFNGARWYLHRYVMVLRGHDIADVEVDHVNRDTSDCRCENLRIASRRLQGLNRGLFKNNTSGAKGVCWHNGAWQVSLKVDGKLRYLGRYAQKHVAEHVYAKALRAQEARG